jgi:methionine-gamma-lyase
VANYLLQNPKVEKVYYLGFTKANNPNQVAILETQYLSNGTMLSFDVKGREKEAFRFLKHYKHIKLAVSFGGTESLAEHPFNMTHADEPFEEKNRLGLSEKMVRLSIGIENWQDIIWDIEHALQGV